MSSRAYERTCSVCRALASSNTVAVRRARLVALALRAAAHVARQPQPASIAFE